MGRLSLLSAASRALASFYICFFFFLGRLLINPARSQALRDHARLSQRCRGLTRQTLCGVCWGLGLMYTDHYSIRQSVLRLIALHANGRISSGHILYLAKLPNKRVQTSSVAKGTPHRPWIVIGQKNGYSFLTLTVTING